MDTSLQEASDPLTPPDRLLALAEQQHLQPIIASNPNTPTGLLLQLAERYPREFIRNPSLELILLEQPELLHRLSASAARAIVAYCAMPIHLYGIFASSPHELVQREVAKLSALPDSVLMNLANSQFESVRVAIASRRSLHPDVLSCCAQTTSEKVLLLVAVHPETTADTLAPLLESGHRAVRSLAARHPRAPKELLSLLQRAGATLSLEDYAEPSTELTEEELTALSRRGVFAQRLAARHPKLPVAIQRALYLSEDLLTRELLAASPSIAIELLEALAKDPKPQVRSRVAANRRTPRHALRSFDHQREDRAVLEALASNPNLPEERFALLIDHAPTIAANFTENLKNNPSLPQEIVRRLVFASDIRIREIAAEHPNLDPMWPQLFTRASAAGLPQPKQAPLTGDEIALLLRGYWGCHLLLQDPELPLSVLERINTNSCDSRFEERLVHQWRAPQPSLAAQIASHPSASPQLIAHIWSAHYNDVSVKTAVAKNPKTPTKTIDAVLSLSPSYVEAELTHNPSVTPEQKLRLFRCSTKANQRALLSQASASPELLSQAISLDDPALRRAASHHPNMPAALLSLLRRAGASQDLSLYQEPDRRVTEEELRSLYALPSLGSYVHAVLARHPNLPDELLSEMALVTPAARSRPPSLQLMHALLSRPNLPVQLHTIASDHLLQETRQLFQYKQPLPPAPYLSGLRPVRLPMLMESERDYYIERIIVTPGQKVKRDDVLFEIGAGPLTVEFTSLESGIVSSLMVREGDTVQEGSLLLVLATQETPNTSPAPPIWIQQRQNLVAMWHHLHEPEPILTQYFVHRPELDTPRYTATQQALAPTNPQKIFWTDGHEVLSGKDIAEQLFSREGLWEDPKQIPAQVVARIVSKLRPEEFGVLLNKPQLHPPLLVREPQGARWIFWARRRDERICWCLWREDGMLRHRALSVTDLRRANHDR